MQELKNKTKNNLIESVPGQAQRHVRRHRRGRLPDCGCYSRRRSSGKKQVNPKFYLRTD